LFQLVIALPAIWISDIFGPLTKELYMPVHTRMLVILATFLLPGLTFAAEPRVDVPFSMGLGQSLYREKCGSCHGTWGDGSDKGPPLMHKLYVPSHHGDKSFYRAAMQGVQAHHWPFGDMPPVTSSPLAIWRYATGARYYQALDG
jgi:hypothetical protein